MTVLTGLKVAIGTSTKTVFQKAIDPFHRPGRSSAKPPPLLRLPGDRHGRRIDKRREIEFPPVEVPDAADQIDGVEVRGGRPDGTLFRVVPVNLRLLDDLQRGPPPVSILNPERTAARLPSFFTIPQTLRGRLSFRKRNDRRSATESSRKPVEKPMFTLFSAKSRIRSNSSSAPPPARSRTEAKISC